jgi:tetratricopeptide (TPR) repeat protein
MATPQESYDEKGQKFIREAQSSLLDDKLSKEDRIKNSINLNTKAANQFKIGKLYASAAQTYMTIEDLNRQLKHADYAAALSLIHAGDMFVFVDTKKAIDAYNKAVLLFEVDGKLSSAAKTMEKIGVIQVTEDKKLEAIQSYIKCYDYHDADASPVLASSIRRRVIDLYIELKMWIESITLLEVVIKHYSTESDLTRCMCKPLEEKLKFCNSKIDMK